MVQVKVTYGTVLKAREGKTLSVHASWISICLKIEKQKLKYNIILGVDDHGAESIKRFCCVSSGDIVFEA